MPLLVKPAGKKSEEGTMKGERWSEAVSLVGLREMMRQLVEEFGAELVRSRWPTEAAARISMPSVVALPHQCDRQWRGVRTVKRKLVLNADGSPWLFFDLEKDPGETRNLVNEPAWQEEIAVMKGRI